MTRYPQARADKAGKTHIAWANAMSVPGVAGEMEAANKEQWTGQSNVMSNRAGGANAVAAREVGAGDIKLRCHNPVARARLPDSRRHSR